MKRSLFKQLLMFALFACSLSADVPSVREQAEWTTDPASLKELRRARGGGRRTDYIWLSAPLAGTTPVSWAVALSVVWPLDGFGIHSMDRACVRWDALPGISLETMNVTTDTLGAVLLVPRYRMPLALPESAWPRPVGSRLRANASAVATATASPWQVWESALSPNVAGRSARADMADMMPRLKKVFIKEGVPQQWVWVAEVESALNPQAKSSAGAVGLFQLMPGTARRFGLQTIPVDDRMEPEKSAGAAAQYLKFLRQEFGCWSLALAAYNAGEGRVKEIMKKRGARTFNEVERYLPSETRAYVPKVMAIVALREDQLRGVRSAYWMP